MSIPQISVDDLAAMLPAGVRLFDVRETHEYVDGHVPGAVHVPLGEVPVRLDVFGGPGPVHVICQAGGRSQRAAEYLVANGVPAVNVAGGTGAWASSGRDLVSGDSPT